MGKNSNLVLLCSLPGIRRSRLGSDSQIYTGILSCREGLDRGRCLCGLHFPCGFGELYPASTNRKTEGLEAYTFI